jgi:hypothetical protein
MSALHELGQSLWLDYMRRDLLTSGKLERARARGSASWPGRVLARSASCSPAPAPRIRAGAM